MTCLQEAQILELRNREKWDDIPKQNDFYRKPKTEN